MEDWECPKHRFVKMYCASCIDEIMGRLFADWRKMIEEMRVEQRVRDSS